MGNKINSKNRPEKVLKKLCCAGCKSPLIALNGGGAYCVKCNFSPTIQETVTWYGCPKCGTVPSKKTPEACENCGQRLED